MRKQAVVELSIDQLSSLGVLLNQVYKAFNEKLRKALRPYAMIYGFGFGGMLHA